MPIAAPLKTAPSPAVRRPALVGGKRAGTSPRAAGLRTFAKAQPFGPVQAKLKVGPAKDRFEQEADRVADQVMGMPTPQTASGEPPPPGAQGPASITPLRGIAPVHRMCAECEEDMQRKPAANTVQRMCSHCEEELHRKPADGPAHRQEEDEEDVVQAKEAPGSEPRLSDATQSIIAGLSRGGSPLPASERAFFEPRFGIDLSDVRIHDGPAIDTAARSIQARAFTLGNHIAFASGQYAPGSTEGRRLLAHELAHNVQQGGGAGAVASRKPVVQRQAATQVTTPTSAPAASLASRVAAFQRLVKNAGKLRLAENMRALEQWRQFLQQQLTPAQVETQVHAEEIRSLLDRAAHNGLPETELAEQWLRTHGANRRWVIEQQIEGRYRACTGCHAAVRADALDWARAEQSGQARTPLEQLRAGPDQGPRPSFAQGEQVAITEQPGVFPRVAQAQERINAIQPYLRMLGPDGYRVLPPETLGSIAAASTLVADISRRISQRQADYREFSSRIDAADFDYLQLRPIVRDLLPLADADVRRAVRNAIQRAETWETVESILVGAATIGLLLLAIFPPTSAIGIGGALSLGAAVGAHQIYRGLESYEQGRLYSLGRGAHNVLDPAQQEAADALMAMGALNIVLGTVGVASSTLGGVRLIRSTAPTGGGGLGAVESVEGTAEGNLYRVTGWGTRDPRVVVTGSNGQVIREGPLSSFRPSASGARASGSTSGGGSYVYPTEGGAARVAQPVPEPIPEPVPAIVPRPVTAPAAPAPVAPNVRALLAAAGAASGLGIVASGAPSQRQPVMPAGLTPAEQDLWRTCNQQHNTYKATQEEAAAYAARMDPIRQRLMQNQATQQDRIDFCTLLDERIRLVQRLHSERLRYTRLNCDQFDWFNTGTTAAERLAQHEIELDNVSAQLRNFYELRNRLCP
jgi:Domain of unknown function (DUF4157)